MKVALIGDVHANLQALEAVLEDARKRRSEAVWNVGDFVGYGQFPDAVVQRLNGRGISSIIGNYDQKVLEFPANKESWRQTKMPEKYLAFGWAYAHLSAESRRFLRTLPQQLLLSVQGVRVLLTHGSPASDEEHLGPDTPPDRLARLAESVDVDVVLCGHSHQPFDRQVNGVRFINPGSVGRPEGEDRRAAYALLTFTRGTLHLLQRRVRYDVTRTVEALRLARAMTAFRRGRSCSRARTGGGVRAGREEPAESSASGFPCRNTPAKSLGSPAKRRASTVRVTS